LDPRGAVGEPERPSHAVLRTGSVGRIAREDIEIVTAVMDARRGTAGEPSRAGEM
jgi:hypothetical protein